MTQSRLKHLLYAVFALVTLCALFEIGLRVYDSATGQLTRKQLYDRGLTVKSWTCHHTLKPSQSFAVRNPDTQKRVKVTLNSFGLRGPEPVVPKPPGTYRILCLGDETTLAQFINENDSYPALLGQSLESTTRLKVEVLNAGVPESCPLLSYLRFRHELIGLQADLVVLAFDMSDVADDYQYRRHTVLSGSGQPLCCPHPDLEPPREQRASKLEDAFLLPEFTKSQARAWFADQTFREKVDDISSPFGRYAWLKDNPPDWSLHLQQALSPVEQLSKLVGQTQGTFVLAACPAPWQVSPGASDGVREQMGVEAGQHFQSRKPFETLAEYCRANEIAFFDPSLSMARERNPDRLYLQNSPTLSRDGHERFASELAKFLEEQRIGLWGRDEVSPQEPLIRHAGNP